MAISLLCASLQALACGPFYPLIPTPDFFPLSRPERRMDYFDREENLRLWQKLTSPGIPLDDIRRAVYETSGEDLYDYEYEYSSSSAGDNLFFVYLHNTGDTEIYDFLDAAKWVEKERARKESPWYYPSSRNSYEEPENESFKRIISRCRDYRGKRLADRYALQIVRSMFAMRDYTGCIEYYDSAFAAIPDRNLMKRMARRYVAGCWSRLGETARADSIFAAIGDVWSVSQPDSHLFMMQVNPDAPQLMEHLRYYAKDTTLMKSAAPAVREMLGKNKVRNRGDWEFLLAHFENEYSHDPVKARSHIYRALGNRFSSDELRDLARAYKMKLDAATGYSGSLIADLQWVERHTGNLKSDAFEWKRMVRNIIYDHWVPRFTRSGDNATAILLAAYADRYSDECSRYGSLSFQMMGSLTSEQLAETYAAFDSGNPLHDYLLKRVDMQRDYVYELIGTLALREENYGRAADYLSTVSRGYQSSMNIFKGNYLGRDPFTAYPKRWSSWTFYDEEISSESKVSTGCNPSGYDAKLKFAREMQRLSEQMMNAPTADERGLARLRYAVGRRNSFEECWALTQYWRGFVGIFSPTHYYYQEDKEYDSGYDYLYDYSTTVGHEKTEEIYNREVAAALAMMESDAARAEAEYYLGNLRTVVRRYGKTPTARMVRKSCDRWRNWL